MVTIVSRIIPLLLFSFLFLFGCAAEESYEVASETKVSLSKETQTCTLKSISPRSTGVLTMSNGNTAYTGFRRSRGGEIYNYSIPVGAEVKWTPNYLGSGNRIRVEIVNKNLSIVKEERVNHIWIDKINTTCPPVAGECFLVRERTSFGYLRGRNIGKVTRAPKIRNFTDPAMVAKYLGYQDVPLHVEGRSERWIKMQSLYHTDANEITKNPIKDNTFFWLIDEDFRRFFSSRTCPPGYRN